MVALTSYVDSAGIPRPIHGVTLLNSDGSQSTASDATAANQVTLATAIGAQADAAWASGNGSVIAILKNIATVATPTYLTTSGNSALAAVGSPADGQSQTGNMLVIASRNYVYNGSTSDRLKKAASTSRIASASATTNATSAKTSAGDLFAIEAYNTTAAIKYLKLYNKASAPVVGTDTPIATFALKPNDRFFKEWTNGRYFATGIAYAITGAATDSDTTALAAGDVVGVNIDYQ